MLALKGKHEKSSESTIGPISNADVASRVAVN